MTDTAGYPVAQNPSPLGYTPNASVELMALTPEETATADALYDELKPMATATARDYVLARTPAKMQDYMVTKIEADWPVPPIGEDAMNRLPSDPPTSNAIGQYAAMRAAAEAAEAKKPEIRAEFERIAGASDQPATPIRDRTDVSVVPAQPAGSTYYPPQPPLQR